MQIQHPAVNNLKMHSREYPQRQLKPQIDKVRPTENRLNRMNIPREYEDQQDSLQLKHTDTQELRDLKGKMRVVISKLAVSKKEKDTLHQQNEELQRQVMSLQNNLRHMVSGFSNSSSSFPIANELASKLAQFYKCDCMDKFFDILCAEDLTIKGIVHFYAFSFNSLSSVVTTYLNPCFASIREVGCLNDLEGPVMNVLRKAFQSKHEKILEKIQETGEVKNVAIQLQRSLNIGSSDAEGVLGQIESYLQKLLKLLLQCRIADPPLRVQLASFGKRVQFNPLLHEAMDGFVKAREECFVILPEIRKCEEGELVGKSLVLHKDYDLGG